jgi:hypothetical protein
VRKGWEVFTADGTNIFADEIQLEDLRTRDSLAEIFGAERWRGKAQSFFNREMTRKGEKF